MAYNPLIKNNKVHRSKHKNYLQIRIVDSGIIELDNTSINTTFSIVFTLED